MIPDSLNPDPSAANCVCGAPDIAHCDGCLARPGGTHDDVRVVSRAVPTWLGSVDVVTAGDLLVWVLPAADPQPYPGATLHCEGYSEDGELCRVWWTCAVRAESGLWPRPTAVFRGHVIADGAGLTE